MVGLKIRGEVSKVNGKEISYSEFAEKYMYNNEPVVLTGLMDDWKACEDWVFPDASPNLTLFSSSFGVSRVQVADCATREFTDQKRIEMSVSEFIRDWPERTQKECDSESKPLLYLKDWHFVKEYPDYSAYETPLFFCDDWLNLYLDKYPMHNDPNTHHQGTNEITCSDYRFVYMGTKGTWTPLHADVFRSYSWSANVCGRKQWYFLAPSQSHLVFDRNMKNSLYSIFEDVDEKKFPCYKQATWLECTQEQNEIIFVPSGWYHQVHNLWDLLLRDYKEAKGYIEDIKDICENFEDLCQRNLAANTGMNFSDFLMFLVRISFANIVQLYHLSSSSESTNWKSSRRAQNIMLNLGSVRNIALKMKSAGVEVNHDSGINFRRLLGDSTFLELCQSLGSSYGRIHEQCNVSFSWKHGDDVKLLEFFESSTSQVCTPEDLASIIDDVCTKFSLACSPLR
ncbi:arginine-specific demethylase JMJ20 isoform X2 [Apium graveolens]|uniref:arginine-specific demethylase JMJ20 isoform X2 n=1 Tax=Apium graveolens TaxID=4045 RepID=UPI003D7BC9B1